MKFTSFFSFFFSFVFLVQSSAWAMGEETLESKGTVAEVVEHMNKMTQAQRMKSFNHYVSALSSIDQQLLRQKLGDVSKLKIPKLEADGNGIAFQHQGKKYTISHEGSLVFTIQGEKFNLAPEVALLGFEQLEDHLSKRKVSFFDYIISPAYADYRNDTSASVLSGVGTGVAVLGFIAMIVAIIASSAVVLIGGAIALAAGGVATIVGHMRGNTSDAIASYCDRMRGLVTDLGTSTTAVDLKKVDIALNRAILDIKNHPGCDSWMPGRKKLCKRIAECLEGVKGEVDSLSSSVSTINRVQEKESRPSNVNRPIQNGPGANKQ